MTTQLELNHIEYMDRCWDSGYSAYKRGRKLSACPLDNTYREAWQDGWRAAKHEYEDAPPED